MTFHIFRAKVTSSKSYVIFAVSVMEQLFEKVIELANNHHIHLVKNHYGTSTVACSVISFAGGIFGGPVGLAIGGLLGGLAAYGISHWTNSNRTSSKWFFFKNKANVIVLNSFSSTSRTHIDGGFVTTSFNGTPKRGVLSMDFGCHTEILSKHTFRSNNTDCEQ